LVLRSPRGAPHRVVETPQLAARTGIHVAHAAHHDVGLIIEIKAVGDELFEFDIRRAVETALAAAISTTFGATALSTWTAAISATISGLAISTAGRTAARAPA